MEFGSSFIYRLLKDIFKFFRGRKLSPVEILRLRNKWKIEFEEKILEWRKEGIRCDVISRDVKRMDDYPHHLISRFLENAMPECDFR